MSIELFEKAINEVSDKDWSWWPFLWLRPARHVPLTLGRLAAVAVLFGLPMGALMSLVLALAVPAARPSASLPTLVFPLSMFFVASVVVGPMWNRRAVRLARRLPLSRSSSEM